MAQERKRALIAAILPVQGGDCYLCEKTILLGDATIDHIWPKGARGRDGLPNLAVAHHHCNRRKGARLPTVEELMIGEFIGMALADLFPVASNVVQESEHVRHLRTWNEGNPCFETALAVALKEAGFA